MRPEEILNARIEALHSGVNSAVQRPDGAQFALMLSMIAASQELAQQLGDKAAGVEAQIDLLADRLKLYTPELVGQMAQAVKDQRPGDMQLWISWLDTVPLEVGLSKAKRADAEVDQAALPLSQAAVLAKRYHMLDEIRDSSLQVAA